MLLHLPSVATTSGKDDRRRRVGLRSDPSAVEDVENEQEGETTDHDVANLGLTLDLRRTGTVRRTRLEVLHVSLQGLGDSDGGQDASNGGQDKHQTDHDSGEVDASNAVENGEDVAVRQLLEAEVDASGEHEDQEVQVKEE